MENLIQLLKDKGYKPFRKIHKKGNFTYKPCDNNYFFSSMIHGFLDIRYIKNNKEFIFGLNEMGKPPTLIYPLPFILKNDIFINCDDYTNEMLRTKSASEIYNAILNNNIIYLDDFDTLLI